MQEFRRFVPTLAAAVVVLATACARGASPQTTIAPLLTPGEQPDSCAASPIPAILPTLAAIGDSGELAQAFARNVPDVAARGAVFSVWFGPAGRVERALVLRPMFDTTSQRPADSVIAADLRSDSTGAAWPVRVRMTAGPVPTFEIDRSRFCPPVPLLGAPTTSSVVVERPITDPSDLREAEDLQHAGPFRLRVLVSATGSVAEVKWLRRSGSTVRDRTALTAARDRRFDPASLDGVPVPAWFDIDSARK